MTNVSAKRGLVVYKRKKDDLSAALSRSLWNSPKILCGGTLLRINATLTCVYT